MKLKIGVILAHPEAEQTFSHFADNADYELIFRTGFLDNAFDLACELQEEKVDAIITLGIPMDVFNAHITVEIFPVYPSSYDIINALYKARDLGEKLAFAEVPFQRIHYDIDRIASILRSDITHYKFSAIEHLSHRESIEKVVYRIIEDGRDVLVTMGGYSYTFAQSLAFPAIMVMPSEKSFLTALDNVKKLFWKYQVDAEKTRWLNAVFDSATEGVMVLDSNQIVVAINPSAQKFMRFNHDKIVGRHVLSIHSSNPLFQKFFNTSSNFEVVKSRTKEYAVKKEILYDGEIPLGTVIRANPMKEIQRLELDARRKISESGFVAKSTFSDIKGSSMAFEKTKQKAANYAKSHSNVILYGESGSGKEIFAQSIHNASLCKNGPFVAINCTVLTETLLESELFGYEDGAFTGAKKGGKPGLFELAHKGTLFLDEIGDMPLGIQVKLLRVLQERIVRRIGGSKNVPIDVRFIFATNRDLHMDIIEGSFRKDLYYRINVLVLHVPSLKDHKEDLKEIAQNILKKLSLQTGKALVLSDEAIRILQKYDWPGNVRELNNFLERAIFLDYHDDKVIHEMVSELMPIGALPKEQKSALEGERLWVDLDTMRNMENSIIEILYQRYNGNRKKLSDTLEISASSLYRRLKEMDIPKSLDG